MDLSTSGRPVTRPALSVVALLGGLAWSGCGGDLNTTDARVTSDTGPASTARVTASWQVRCDELGDCAGNPARMLAVSNGEGGALVECGGGGLGDDPGREVR